MDELKKMVSVLESGQIADQLPYLVAENVALQAYNDHLEWREDHFRYDWEQVEGLNGKVWIIEVPSGPHASAAAEFYNAVHEVVGRTLRSKGGKTYPTDDNNEKMEADRSWAIELPESSRSSSSPGSHGSTASHSSSGTREKQTFVLEVGYRQSANHLRDQARRWLDHTTVNEVVLLKINPDNRDDLWAEIWRRDTFRTAGQPNPVQSIRFGGKNTHTAVGQRVLLISLAAVYDGAGNIPPGLHNRNGVIASTCTRSIA